MTQLTLAELYLSQRDLTRAAHYFKQAKKQGTSDRVDAGLWQLHMLSGDFEQAWQASDRIRARTSKDPHRFWTGESIVRKDVLIRSLHGLGDAVQMFQYAGQLSSLANSVTWQVPPKLQELAGYFQDVDHVITWDQPCRWDLQVEITELPYLFRSTLPNLPFVSGYLTLPVRPRGSGRPRVGVVWASGEWNQSRSVSLAALNPILSTRGCDFISLQGDGLASTDDRLTNIDPGLLPLATVMAGLDLVITVDTLAAHLGGALRIPTFVLLEQTADWRWMTGRDDCPWYPSLRLFRQPTAGDWETPIEAVRQALGRLIQ